MDTMDTMETMETMATMDTQFDIAADLDTPVSAYLKLAPFHPRFLLESVEGGDRLGRYSFIGLGEGILLRIEGDALSLRIDGRTEVWPLPARDGSSTQLLAALRRALE